ncbi:ATP-binding protein, partial [bacterium]|nr:ATP-binding protein [bacterium]
ANEVTRQVRLLDPQREIHETVQDVTALGDRDAIKQILLVLLDNAVKHTSGPVNLSAQAVNGHIELSVQDSGPGIAPEQLEHIYDRFNRGEADPQIPGFGLGLPIAKALAEGQGGSIQIESEVGIGSKVIVNLPRFDQKSA